MGKDKPVKHYKDLQEMLASPEYKHLVELIRQGIREGILDSYPPLPLPELKED